METKEAVLNHLTGEAVSSSNPLKAITFSSPKFRTFFLFLTFISNHVFLTKTHQLICRYGLAVSKSVVLINYPFLQFFFFLNIYIYISFV